MWRYICRKMIAVYLHNGKFEQTEVNSFSEIRESLAEVQKEIQEVPISAIVEILNELSKKFISEQSLRNILGSQFLAMWLKRKNITETINLNVNDIKAFDEFIELRENNFIKYQPRGLICQWIAANVPTLAMFSLVQSLLCKNTNLLRIPQSSVDTILTILKELDKINVEYKGKTYSGSLLVKATSVIYFPKEEKHHNEEMALIADGIIVWGGSSSVTAIKLLPTKEHCEHIIFGPKYSFGVFDKEFIESEDFEKALQNALMDSILFDQEACSSPHVLFFEKNNKHSIDEIEEKMKKIFTELGEKYPKDIDPGKVARIINARAKYLLDEDKKIVSSKDTDWTILVNNDLALEDPIQSRTLFVKEINDIFETPKLITRKVQTVGIGIKDKEKALKYADQATKQGVARCVKYGTMHYHESPWDGILALNRLSRFVTVKK